MKIAVIPNYRKGSTHSCTSELLKMLDSQGCEYILKEYQSGDEYIKSSSDMTDADVFVAIGGDGTIIHTAKIAAELGKPILGINSGTLGFTASIECDELPAIQDVLRGNYSFENRIMLEAELISGANRYTFSALNDIVISGERSQIINYNMSIAERKCYEYRADGMIFATPTGSTAYSLSAGGPVVEPTLECMIYTPICPHSLFNRSTIFDSDTEVFITFSENRSKLILTVDGAEPIEIKPEDMVVFRKSDLFARFISLEKKNFYDTLNKKIVSDKNNRRS